MTVQNQLQRTSFEHNYHEFQGVLECDIKLGNSEMSLGDNLGVQSLCLASSLLIL